MNTWNDGSEKYNLEAENVRLREENLRLAAKNLLAVIHRDGGHHTEAVGIEQSFKDAEKICADNLQLRESLAKAEADGRRKQELLDKAILYLRQGHREFHGKLAVAVDNCLVKDFLARYDAALNSSGGEN